MSEEVDEQLKRKAAVYAVAFLVYNGIRREYHEGHREDDKGNAFDP